MKRFLALTSATLLLAACGASAADRAAQSASGAQSSSVASSEGGYPIDIVSCGQNLHFDRPPSRVIMLGDTGYSNLDALGLADRGSLRAGDAHYGSAAPELQTKHDAIESVDAGKTDTGGVMLSTETVLNSKADLVIGYDKGVEREQLASAGVQLYSPEAYCPNYSVDKASWDLIDTEVNNLARIFGKPDAAATVLSGLRSKTDALKAAAPADRGSAAAIYMATGATQLHDGLTAGLDDIPNPDPPTRDATARTSSGKVADARATCTSPPCPFEAACARAWFTIHSTSFRKPSDSNSSASSSTR